MKVGSTIFVTILYPALLLTLIVAQDEKDAFASTVFALCMVIPIFFGLWAIASLYLRTVWCILLLAILLYIHDWWSVAFVVIVFLLIQMILSRNMTKEAVFISSPSPHRLYVYQGKTLFLSTTTGDIQPNAMHLTWLASVQVADGPGDFSQKI